MPKPRKAQISLKDTSYYHCVSRCVRRSFLCGVDSYTGKSYEHRREWVENRLHFLSSVFTIDICAYAVMSNHTHIVLHIDESKARSLKASQVLERWHKMYSGTLLTQRYANPETRCEMSEGERETVFKTIEVYRKRLFDISWFMRCLNEFIAREANKEDNCTGRFWEGRFKSQALLDEKALITCMSYVDLNPVRAGLAKTPESSQFTSIFQRLKTEPNNAQPTYLMRFAGDTQLASDKCLPIAYNDYVQLLRQTFDILSNVSQISRSVDDKVRVGQMCIGRQNWIVLVTQFEQHFSGAVGMEQNMRKFQHHAQMKSIPGISAAKKFLKSS